MSNRRYGKARRRTFPCNHRGWGQYCHRCAHADLLERAERTNTPPPLAYRKLTAGELVAEAMRLRQAAA